MKSEQKPKEIYISSTDEVATLPVYPELPIGSVAIYATTGEVYMLNTDGWHAL